MAFWQVDAAGVGEYRAALWWVHFGVRTLVGMDPTGDLLPVLSEHHHPKAH